MGEHVFLTVLLCHSCIMLDTCASCSSQSLLTACLSQGWAASSRGLGKQRRIQPLSPAISLAPKTKADSTAGGAGLAEDWNPDDNIIFTKSSFSQGGNFPAVEDNVFLVKGLFSDSLPPFLQQQKAWASGFRQRGSYTPTPLTYLHIDCGAPDSLAC